MKTIGHFLGGAALFMAATAACAEPISFDKLSGANFDVWYRVDPGYSASLDGNTLSFTLRNFEIATNSFSGGPNVESTVFIVAHDGKAVKSAYGQSFQGGYDISPGILNREGLQVNVYSNFWSAAFDGEYVEFIDQLSNKGNYINVRANADWRQGVIDSAGLGVLDAYQESYGRNDGQSYRQFGFDMYAALYAYTDVGGAGVRGWLDEIRFDFETVGVAAETPGEVPEPAGIALFAVGAAAFAARRRKAAAH